MKRKGNILFYYKLERTRPLTQALFKTKIRATKLKQNYKLEYLQRLWQIDLAFVVICKLP